MKILIKCFPLFFALVALLGCKDEIPQKEMIRPVRAMQISDPAEFTKRWFPGQAKATQEVDLSFRVAGPLVALSVNIGDTVRKGQELAKIDPRDYQVDLRSAQGQLERAKASLKRAEADYDRVLRIQKQDPGAVSQSLVDSNRQKAASNRAEIRSLQAAVDSAGDRLGYTYLKAPFDGIITATYVENYEDVKAKQPIVRLIDNSRIEMIVSIPEVLISHADYLKEAGKVFRVRFDSFPGREIEAQIKEVGKEASRTTRTYPVTLIMDQPEDIKILPGMAGNAASTISPPGIQGRLQTVIPETAVFSPEENKTFVWIIDEKSKKVNKREVKTGDLMDSGITIREGIEPGEWIATAGVHYLKEGQEVRILSASTEEVAK
ncbi:MAG: efflux RND transporter periplasmic adaptor subunit [Deltaproteobacteria bacterium]|jgi:RND family efflux transporter MFP subunit|nr:efflux RND transporter periplasmic adaptor subunit [Deltaproteobacteria bacterium]